MWLSNLGSFSSRPISLKCFGTWHILLRCKTWEIRKLWFIRDQDQEENLADVLGLMTDFSVMRRGLVGAGTKRLGELYWRKGNGVILRDNRSDYSSAERRFNKFRALPELFELFLLKLWRFIHSYTNLRLRKKNIQFLTDYVSWLFGRNSRKILRTFCDLRITAIFMCMANVTSSDSFEKSVY